MDYGDHIADNGPLVSDQLGCRGASDTRVMMVSLPWLPFRGSKTVFVENTGSPFGLRKCGMNVIKGPRISPRFFFILFLTKSHYIALSDLKLVL